MKMTCDLRSFSIEYVLLFECIRSVVSDFIIDVEDNSVRLIVCFFFVKQKTAYEIRISDWSSDVCSSDLPRRYWYRFVVDGIRSDTGTVRTAPAAGAALDRLRIAVAGCQHYERGLFTAWRHISREADLDAVYHYGDYIYEGKPARAAAAAKAPIEIGRAHV